MCSNDFFVVDLMYRYILNSKLNFFIFLYKGVFSSKFLFNFQCKSKYVIFYFSFWFNF